MVPVFGADPGVNVGDGAKSPNGPLGTQSSFVLSSSTLAEVQATKFCRAFGAPGGSFGGFFDPFAMVRPGSAVRYNLHGRSLPTDHRGCPGIR